ncbi:Glutamate receptor-interacting protein 2-like protein [Aphelenchoides bicaudatus]|nr:Glutamate receptor-interacting protein 2-like protein [Aphelenchoides bicaudatus]
MTTGMLHAKMDLFACGSFGTVTNLRTYDNAVCTSHTETAHIHLDLIGADSYGLSLKRVCSPSSSNLQSCKCAQIVVDFIQPNSPAANSGQVQVGDRLLSVDGHKTNTLTVEEIFEIFESSVTGIELHLEFDVYETCTTLHEIIAIRLLKQSNQLGIELNSGTTGRKEDPIIVKSVLMASVAYRCGAIETGDEFIAIDDIPMSNCSVDEAVRKRNAIGEKKSSSCNEESVFNYTVELKSNNESLGLSIGEDMRVVGMQKDGLCWRTGSICIGDRIVSIDGREVDQSLAQVQQRLNEHTDGSLLLGMTRRLQLAPRLDSLSLQTSNGSSRQNSINDVHRASTPSGHNRLNLIDIQKVIGAMATSIQHKELQALRAFEHVEDQLLVGRPFLQRSSISSEEHVPKRIGQRLSSDSFSSSGFGSASAFSQQSAPETPSCSCSHSTVEHPMISALYYSPVSLFDPHTKNVLLLRDPDQSGFGFSISESRENGVFVNAVKPGSMAEQNGICPNDRILQVNNVNTTGMSCSQLLPLFDSDILELVLYNEPDITSSFKL